MGASTYTIPLLTPPDVGGVLPDLAITYDSQRGPGLLGPGWAFSGLSSITRCARTQAQDGYVSGITFTASDAFCFEGTRLIATLGTYGGDGTQYRTENESFAMFLSLGTTGTGPTSFRMFQKDGLVYEFGITDDGRLQSQGAAGILSWKLNKIWDRSGNYITITYFNDPVSGENTPAQIDYTGNSNTGVTPYNSIRFIYEALPAPSVQYLGGAAFTIRSHLTRIQELADGATAREYRFWYNTPEPIAQEVRLRMIQQCGTDGSCLPTTNLFWGSENTGGPLFQGVSTPLNDLSPQQDYANSTTHSLIMGDWDGDGRMDISRNNKSNTVTYRSTGNGFAFFGNFYPATETDVILQGRSLYETFAEGLPSFSGDWNGDGRTDIGRATLTHGIAFYLSTSSGWQYFTSISGLGRNNGYSDEVHYPILTGDWNGDGKTDFGRVGGSVVYLYLSGATGFTSLPDLGDFTSAQGYSDAGTYPILTGDWNGDGLTDIGRVAADGFGIHFSTGSGFGPRVLFANLGTAQGYTDNNAFPLLSGDFNGDGLTDIGRVFNGGIRVCPSTGTGFATCFDLADLSPAQGFSNGSTYPIFTGDFNADGVTDIGRVTTTGISYYTLKNGSFSGPFVLADYGTNAGYSDGSTRPMVVGDLNGDGFTDVGRISGSGVTYYNRTATQSNLLANIIDGLGHRIQVSYDLLTTWWLYSKGSGATYPSLDLQYGLPVVSWVATWDGLGNPYWSSYHYTALRTDLNGRGISGFQQVDVTDSQTGVKTSTFYRQDHPYKGQPYKTEMRQSDGKLIRSKEDTWAANSYPYGSYFPYISQSQVKDYEIDGSLIKTASTTFTYDSYGNVTQAASTASDAYGETTNNSYTNDEYLWIFGRLDRSSVSKSAPGFPTVTRTKSFEYDAPRNLVTKEIIEPDNAPYRMEKRYEYDQYGNGIRTKVFADGVETLIEQKTFDTRGQFPITTTNGLNQSDQQTFDARFGAMTSITGPNNLTTTYTLDSFGQVQLETRANQTKTRTLLFKADTGAPANSAYFSRVDTSGESPRITYFDVLGRELRSVTVGFDGRNIFVDRTYNARGELVSVSDPYFEGTAPQFTTSEYDLFGRIFRVTAPGNRITTTSYAGVTSTVTNPLNQSIATTVNSLGKTVAVVDSANGRSIYKYDSAANMVETTDPVGNHTTSTFDIRGNRTSITDPDAGLTTFTYDARGRVTQQQSGGLTTSMTYDALDRLVTRTSPEGFESWEYDTAANGIGKIAVTRGTGGQVETYQYDNYGRLQSNTKSYAGTSYTMNRTFDEVGRTVQLTYPSGWGVNQVYNSFGFFSEIRAAQDNALIWRADARNARSQLEHAQFGNGLMATYSYDTIRGLPARFTISGLHDLEYTFDALGNFLRRKDYILGKEENFQYDNLNRLASSQVTGGSVVTVSYDPIGNITSRSDVGTYTYGGNGAGPHAVTSIAGPGANTFTYDNRGNRITSFDQAITYSSYNIPVTITTDTNRLIFTYDPSHARINQRIEQRTSGTLIEDRFYFDGMYEEASTSTSVEKVHYIKGSDGLVATYTTATGKSPAYQYVHVDHLGSISTITNGSGQVTERVSFDAWGKRRNSDWTSTSQPIMSSINRGFTGHEHLDEANLIHMNGRVYDPIIGRFLSVDPIVQNPFDAQSLNRYSYVLNNPLSFTDPTGMFSLKKFFKRFIPFVASVATMFIPGLQGLQPAIVGALSAFNGSVTASLLNGRSLGDSLKAGLKAAPWGGIQAQTRFLIGGAFQDSRLLVRAAAHGITQGAISRMQGGRFSSGFYSAALGTVGGQSAGLFNDKTLGLVGASLAGGVGAVLSKGKFFDGAIQAAFVYRFNDCGNHEEPSGDVMGDIAYRVAMGQEDCSDWTPPVAKSEIVQRSEAEYKFNLLSGSYVIDMAIFAIPGLGEGAMAIQAARAAMVSASLALKIRAAMIDPEDGSVAKEVISAYAYGKIGRVFEAAPRVAQATYDGFQLLGDTPELAKQMNELDQQPKR